MKGAIRLPKKYEKYATNALPVFAEFYGLGDEVVLGVTVKDELGYDAIAEKVEDNPLFNYGILFRTRELHKMDEREFIKTLAHEITHIKQFIYDDLVFFEEEDSVEFRGELYRFENSLEYWLAPWEVEARGMELALWAVYLKATDPFQA